MEGWTAAYHAAGIRPRDGFSRWTQLIARSAIFLSAFPYNVPRTENPPGVFSRII